MVHVTYGFVHFSRRKKWPPVTPILKVPFQRPFGRGQKKPGLGDLRYNIYNHGNLAGHILQNLQTPRRFPASQLAGLGTLRSPWGFQCPVEGVEGPVEGVWWYSLEGLTTCQAPENLQRIPKRKKDIVVFSNSLTACGEDENPHEVVLE